MQPMFPSFGSTFFPVFSTDSQTMFTGFWHMAKQEGEIGSICEGLQID
jgi:hypothetical protein